MQWRLFVLILIGQCSIFLCHMYEYHFINKPMTWKQAQDYCRVHHTDLAILYDMADMTRLRDSKNQNGAWIGLQNHTNGNGMWQWSLPGAEYNENNTLWSRGEPDNSDFPENCVALHNSEWSDRICNDSHSFVCYDAENSTEWFSNMKMTWPQALNYCRVHHTDLFSETKTLNTSTTHTYWIGLFRDTWQWSDGRTFSFRYWDLEAFKDDESSKTCAMTFSNGTWDSNICEESKPFFCYNSKVILIRMNKTWEEALNYCRENHYDLASITNARQQRWVQDEVKKANSAYVWLGLRYTCVLDFWFWVTDEVVHYENWAAKNMTEDCDFSAAMSSGGQHKWFRQHDGNMYNFLCFK